MSKMIKRYDAAAGRDYVTHGQTKTHWINVGSATAWDDGTISFQMHALPCFQGWSGKIQFFPVKEQQFSPPVSTVTHEVSPF